jgi:hypothetical protein
VQGILVSLPAAAAGGAGVGKSSKQERLM